MPAFETLFSSVNRWECDENDHLNVQFYFTRFEEADRQFRLLSGLSDALVGSRRVRHVRYHCEQRCGAMITGRSFIAFDGPHMLTVVHELREGDRLAATAVDGYSPPESKIRELRRRFRDAENAMPETAAPRGLPATVPALKATPEALIRAGAAVVNRSTVLQRDLGPDGRADDGFALGRFTEAAPHIWARTPMAPDWLAERGLGRVAVEMKLAWAGPLKLGDPVVVISGLTGASNTIFSFRHHMFEARANRLAAVCDVVALAMDLDTRKAVPLEPEVRKAIASMVLS